ncbi:OprO/OprP family phosphate-selective porin [Adhaeribacter rhizoryzae]|uniref:Porin n=1 Tax=Adhaeribacter rhizoryzae TaxID=2607907 RepID=A0A5M6D759_9BACT|nr:porin [Adhaeribacter rhizoryzae]KAA5541689.1 hypothetical protein F0145_20180 [Adhaeribacter rhizoryzae]
MTKTLLLLFWVLMLNSAYAQSNLQAYWDDGLNFQSQDSLFRFSVGGRVHYDVAFTGQSAGLDSLFGTPSAKVQVRRARLSFEGSLNKAFTYEFEFTFGETIEFADMYFAFLEVPFLEQLTIGHFREPFGLEEMTSSNAIVFMERSLTSAFGPSRNTGIMVQKQFFNKKLRGYAGMFRITDDLGNDLKGKGNHSFSSRWAYTPLVASNNRLLHLGLSYNNFTPINSIYSIEPNNEVNTEPEYMATHEIAGVRKINQLVGEIGYTKGPLTIQSEWVSSRVNLPQSAAAGNGENSQLHKSFYLMTSYFLKGGYRSYSSRGNRFSAIKLTQKHRTGSLSGAWETGLRFSYLDLSEARQPIHTLSNVTAGLNWYYNSNTRVMFNYVYSLFNNGLKANTLQLRMQASF